jgi:hypothetical protein
MTFDAMKERIGRLEAEIEESRQEAARLRGALSAVLNISEAALKSNSQEKKSWFSSELLAASIERARKPE